MLTTKEMPHRSSSCTGYSHKGGVVCVDTLRKSCEPDITGRLTLSAIQSHIVKVEFVEGEAVPPQPSLVVIQDAVEASFQVTETDAELHLRTADLEVVVNKTTCALTYRDGKDASLYLQESPEGGKELTRIDIERAVHDKNAETTVEESVDGVKVRAAQAATTKDREGFCATHSFALEEDEAVYGLGQHEEGFLNYRHRQQFLYQQNMKVAMPVMVSTKGYGLYWDTLALTTFNDLEDETHVTIDAASSLTYYFIAGPAFDRIIAGVRHLSGQLPMLPRWAYGYLQSKERYESAEELLQIVQEYRRRQVPLDCVILDWHSWAGNLWGQKTLDPERFPDPAGMMDGLHKENAKLMVSIWPHMQNEGENHVEFREAGELLGNDSNYNAFSEKGRALYWKQTKEGLFDHGIDAYWCDCTEPFESDWHGEHRRDPYTRMNINTAESKKYLDPMVINGFSLMHSQGLYEGQRATESTKRVVNLTRSASVGQHRYNTITWSGDIEARWSRLRKQIADGLNFTITGSPRWTLDIGAFFVKPGTPWFWDGQYPEGNRDLGYRELYLRWLQMAVFLPIFRSHGTDTAREIWCFGDEGEPYYDALKASIELRYQLLPYLYSLAGWECQRGYTTFRNLAFDFREDTQVYDIADQFMCGPSLMACPVLEPQEYGPNSTPLRDAHKRRSVYLPKSENKGTLWYDFHTHEQYEGGQWIEVDTPIDRIPTFVPAGSIIPIGPVTQHASADRDAPWTLRVYPGVDGSFDIYDDAGDGYGYEQGEYMWQRLTWDESALTVGPVEGSYPSMVKREYEIEIIRS